MAPKKPVDGGHHACRMDEILLERDRLDQVIEERFRKKVTILFSDVCGFTQYTDKRGDIQGRTLLVKHNRLVLPVIETHNGRVIEIVGDGIMAAFDDPVHACKAAAAIQQSLKAYSNQTATEDRIHVKIGLNSGNALMDRDAAYQSLAGDVANVAARIQSNGKMDQILISPSVYDQIRGCDNLHTRFHGNVQLKGKTGDMALYRLIWDDDDDGIAMDSLSVVGKQSIDSSPHRHTTTIINLDLNIEGNQLKVSADESRLGEKSTISRYDTTVVSPNDIEARCRQLVDTLNKANRRGRVTRQVLMKLREIGQVLYDELLTLNVKEILRTSQADTLIIKIDDQLVHIPWELLYDGKQFLCLRYNMGRVVKTRQTIASPIHRKLQQPLDMLILADPTGDLKGAYAEGIQIRDFMDQSPDLINTTLRSNDTSAENIKAKLRNFDIVHYAGHSDYDSNHPESSGWRLHGGNLCTNDITKMAGSAKMPALIFANACQSARTEQWTLQASFESKIFGLANAFLVAGVKHYLGTFWEVPDESSSRFAVEYYKHLFSDLSVGEALRKARLTLIELYGEETIVWASYVLYGDPTFDYMARSRSDSSSIQGTGPQGLIKPSSRNRTREEVIDFSESRIRGSATSRWALAFIILLVAGAWLFGWRWYTNRKFEKIEHQAMALYHSGDFESAAQLCQNVQKEIPGSPLSSLILGNIYLGRGDMEAARRNYQSAVDSEQSAKTLKSEALLGLGRLASMEHQPQKALQLYQSAAAVDSKSARALRSQAIILEQQNHDAEALRIYRQALDRFPNDPEIQSAAQDIRERLSWAQDQARQSRIDQLVKELLNSDLRTNTAPEDETRWTSKPLSVWLLDFEEAGFCVQEGQSRVIQILVRDLLTKNHRFKMVERAVLDKLLAELHLGASQLAERKTALSIGRLMATRILLPGQVQYAAGQALFSFRAIECETGLITASVIGTYNSSMPSIEIAEDLTMKISKELISKFPNRCQVSEINGTEIVLDIGQNLSVQKGQYFKGIDNNIIVQITSVSSVHSTAVAIQGKDVIAKGLKLEEKIPDSS